jgi:hypothetical protein
MAAAQERAAEASIVSLEALSAALRRHRTPPDGTRFDLPFGSRCAGALEVRIRVDTSGGLDSEVSVYLARTDRDKPHMGDLALSLALVAVKGPRREEVKELLGKMPRDVSNDTIRYNTIRYYTV